jgi:hypothetical protein
MWLSVQEVLAVQREQIEHLLVVLKEQLHLLVHCQRAAAVVVDVQLLAPQMD